MKELAETKHQDKLRKWEEIREDEKRKAAFEDRMIRLEEKKRRESGDDDGSNYNGCSNKEWWEIRRVEILEAKKARREASSASAAAAFADASINFGAGGGGRKWPFLYGLNHHVSVIYHICYICYLVRIHHDYVYPTYTVILN
jgi:hypothetical protein